jgi:hypothetical protein
MISSRIARPSNGKLPVLGVAVPLNGIALLAKMESTIRAEAV